MVKRIKGTDKNWLERISFAKADGTEIKKVEIEDPEQRKANELINNPEVRELLMDSGVQNLFMLLRNNPENSQKLANKFYLQ